MINGFTDPACSLGSLMDDTVETIAHLLTVFRSHRAPIFFTTVIYEDLDARDGGWFVVKVPSLKLLTPNSPWVEVDKRLKPMDNEPVLVKKYASAFFGTKLSELLNQGLVDTAVITGCTTSGCVRATAIDALQYGFRPIIPIEAVADRSAEAHKASLQDLAVKYADVLPLAELLPSLAFNKS
jgi:nicotinamidase-related amidase